MAQNLKKIQDADVKNKTVFLRADLDVPITEYKTPISKQDAGSSVADYSRLEAWFPTLEYLLKQNSKVIIGGHLGRPDGKDYGLSVLSRISGWINYKLKISLSENNHLDYHGFEARGIGENIILLENLRFNPGEETNDPDFAQKLASLAQIYVNDAFASSHRSHASIVGITKYLPSYAGLHLQKEVEELSKVLDSPERPLTVIIGGAKIETKLPLVEKMHKFADYVLVGGEIAENDKVLARVAHEKSANKKSILIIADLNEDMADITPNSFANFYQPIQESKMIVWNGPMGKVEEQKFQPGTKELAKAITNSKAYTIVGGGDTVSFLEKEGLINKFSFVSVGGGAMLEFLAGEKLPGIVALS